ncbi:uncharacterized protein [Nicotiana tomentosiformis]|uniref:uncharacterized protein n=1 Tax=Nicotiana tomentosiformis TaxID=4098 RepID=UPI00388C90F4
MSSEALLRLDNFTKLFPFHFNGTPSEDPQDYLDHCHEFSRLFLKKFLPITLREDYRMQFERLQHGSMAVTQYESRFVDFARHALLLIPTNGERVRWFIKGLTHPIKLRMAKKAGSEISFQDVANVARRIEMVLAKERGKRYDKRPRQFGGFSGASSGGMGNFGAYSAHISAPPLQSHYNGYSTLSGQRSQQSRFCYTCGDPRHIFRLCPMS